MKCNCKSCNNEGTVKMSLNRRGGRNVYYCDFHARNMYGYFTKNNLEHGTKNSDGMTYGMELETWDSTLKARAEILANDYIPTSDSTVRCEYKSPIMHGLNSLSKQCVTYDKLIASGDLDISPRHCGTHFHVGHETAINEDTIEYLRRFYHSLFIPLSNAIVSESAQETTAFWGRDINGDWAQSISESTSPTRHENFINLQHKYTIEFRLPLYRNADQYMRVARFCRDVTKTIISNFINHFNDTDFDQKRYKTITDYRKHKAQVTAQKIVKLYEKAKETM